MRRLKNKIQMWVEDHSRIFQYMEGYDIQSLKHAPELAWIVYEVKAAFALGKIPQMHPKATGEAYLLKDCEDEVIAIFKPRSSPYMGGDALREYATYRLDHERFAKVPPTALVELTHPLLGGRRRGSIQEYVPNTKTLIHADYSEPYPTDSSCIRRIAALDIRILNEDRHGNNLLVYDNVLIPIDHSSALGYREQKAHFEWRELPEADTHFNKEERAYILSLSGAEDRKMLDYELGLRPEVGRGLHFATLFLQEGVRRYYTPLALGDMICPTEGACSPFQRLLYSASDESRWTSIIKNFYNRSDETDS